MQTSAPISVAGWVEVVLGIEEPLVGEQQHRGLALALDPGVAEIEPAVAPEFRQRIGGFLARQQHGVTEMQPARGIGQELVARGSPGRSRSHPCRPAAARLRRRLRRESAPGRAPARLRRKPAVRCARTCVGHRSAGRRACAHGDAGRRSAPRAPPASALRQLRGPPRPAWAWRAAGRSAPCVGANRRRSGPRRLQSRRWPRPAPNHRIHASFPPGENLERATGFEPATYGLGSRRSTPELHPLSSHSSAAARPEVHNVRDHVSRARQMIQMGEIIRYFLEAVGCEQRRSICRLLRRR